MEAASDSIEPFASDTVGLPGFNEIEVTGGGAAVVEPGLRRRSSRVRAREAGVRARARLSAIGRQELLWICVLYLSARIMLLLAAFIQSKFGNAPFQNELANWDGMWYRELANQGYPTQVSYGQTTLGFFPLFPLTIWPLEQVLLLVYPNDPQLTSTLAGAIISGAGGLIATVLVHRLAEGWWDREAARRATIIFVLFPGSVVFTMVYSEGILLPLVAGCLYALERRRWVLAGVLAGFGTAVQPVGLALGPVCALAALLEIRRSGLHRAGLRSLIAPLLSVTGAGSFMLFLWLWTGNPFANYIAQHHGWSESTTPLALVHVATQLASQISFSHFNEPTINLNLISGLLGAVFMAFLLVLLWRSRREVSAPAIAWSLAIAFLGFTSSQVPPNPRMLITAFPALMTIGRYSRGRWFPVIAWVMGVLLVGMSLLTFFGLTLRP